jgi:hypothetical protein
MIVSADNCAVCVCVCMCMYVYMYIYNIHIYTHMTGGLLSSLGVEGLRGAGTRGRTAKRHAFQAVRKAAEAEIEGSRDGWARVHTTGSQTNPQEVDLDEIKAAAGD